MRCVPSGFTLSLVLHRAQPLISQLLCGHDEGLVHHIGDEAGTHTPRVTLPSPRIVTGFNGEEPGSAQEEEGVKTKKRDGALHPKVSPASVRVSGLRVSVLPLGPKASCTWPRASLKAARKRERRGQRSVERAARGNKDRHMGKRCAAGSPLKPLGGVSRVRSCCAPQERGTQRIEPEGQEPQYKIKEKKKEEEREEKINKYPRQYSS
ncbi:hypothetical protein NDU88_007885 [Pleurodeles waltl]|uniref:Uncharacterized protein n=1 Tax=Pleurodeles waltl TaxID=8319 RepID=A0AAV7VTL6_PLEWA|nr:hypothetical protein NDU88_007885 [Pleurodeles waltl]